jgi:hypothetical protein
MMSCVTGDVPVSPKMWYFQVAALCMTNPGCSRIWFKKSHKYMCAENCRTISGTHIFMGFEIDFMLCPGLL